MTDCVAITGVGVICGAGVNITSFKESLRYGTKTFSRLEDSRFRHLKATHASLVTDLPKSGYFSTPVDRHVALSLVAIEEALHNAGLGTENRLGERAAVVLGTCSGGMSSSERHYEQIIAGESHLDEDLLFAKQYHTAVKVLAYATGAAGPSFTVVTACAAGTGALVQGADLIRSGLVDLVLAGGADAFAPSTLVGFDALKATCEGQCEPFSKNIGLNLGEGAAFFVLENSDHARGRGAPVLASIIGSGLSNDAYHPTAPDPSTKGQVMAMERAIVDAGIEVCRLDYVNAHGTGTRSNDPIESKAISAVLGEWVAEVPVSSTKSIIGHCLGGAGALEAAATVLAAKEGFFPSTAGFSTPRKGCTLPDYVPDANRPWKGRYALSNSFGFGGSNACIVLDVSSHDMAETTGKGGTALARPVVSGIGTISAAGLQTTETMEKADCFKELTRFSTPYKPCIAGLVPPLDPRQVDRRLNLRGMDLCSQYVTLATRLALNNAELPMRPAVMVDTGMVLGLASGHTASESAHLEAVFESDFNIDRLGAFPYVVPNEVAGNAARSLMLKGHSTVLAGGKGAGLAALISAICAVEQGHTSRVIAASSDEITERELADRYSVGAWGPNTGIIPGEGAAALVIEEAKSVKQRGGRVQAEIFGYGVATDVEHPKRATGYALSRALFQALDRSGVKPDEIVAAACTLDGSDSSKLEQSILLKKLPRAEQFSLFSILGCAEATLPLLNLSKALISYPTDSLIACASLSDEGFARVVILRRV